MAGSSDLPAPEEGEERVVQAERKSAGGGAIEIRRRRLKMVRRVRQGTLSKEKPEKERFPAPQVYVVSWMQYCFLQGPGDTGPSACSVLHQKLLPFHEVPLVL